MTIKKVLFATCCSVLTVSEPVFAQDAGWQYNMQGLALQRSGVAAVPLVVDGGGSTVYLSSDVFNRDLGGGLKFSAAREINDRTDWVIDGFFTKMSSATQTIGTPGAQLAMYGSSLGNSPISLDYDSSLIGAGTTWRFASQNGKLRWLGGLRAMRLDESLAVVDC